MRTFITTVCYAVLFACLIVLVAVKINAQKPTSMNVLYAVPWVESEADWGAKPEGYKVFNDLEECKSSTRESSDSSGGNYYIGPERPLHYYEIPDEIEGPFPKFVDRIRFKSTAIYIK